MERAGYKGETPARRPRPMSTGSLTTPGLDRIHALLRELQVEIARVAPASTLAFRTAMSWSSDGLSGWICG